MMKRVDRWYFLVFALILFFGVTVRISAYLQAPALWYDEAFFANKLIHLPMRLMILPEEGKAPFDERMQPYPAGFLALLKLSTVLLGPSELALRFVPFLAGIISLLVFRRLSDIIFKRPWNLFAFALFAACYPVIYRSVELKPYAIDVLVVLLICLFALGRCRRKAGPPVIASVAAGGIAMFFSFPALIFIFTLIGCGALYGVIKKNWDVVRRCVLTGGLILIMFAGYFMVSIRHVFSGASFSGYWDGYFSALTRNTASLVFMTAQTFQEMFSWWGFPAGLALLLMILGAIRTAKRDRLAFVCFAVPVAVAIGASFFHVYPFVLRTATFVIPLILVLMIFGIQMLGSLKFRFAARVLPVLAAAVLLAGAVTSASNFYRMFSFGEDIRPLIRILDAHYHRGDSVYVNNFGQPAYCFYNYLIREKDNPFDYDGIIGDLVQMIPPDGANHAAILFYPRPFSRVCAIDAQQEIFCDKEDTPFQFSSGRNWIVLSHTRADAREILLNYLDSIGDRMMAVQSDRDAFLYLYDIPAQDVRL